MLVQLVCLDRRYQRMNCYNIREIQTILKSKYSPNTAESADVRFGLEETILGLRYQLNGIESIDPALSLFYKNALSVNAKYNSVHNFLNKPIVNFDSTKLFLSRCTLLFSTIANLPSEYLISTTTSTEMRSLPNFLVSCFLPSIKLDKTILKLDSTVLTSHRPFWALNLRETVYFSASNFLEPIAVSVLFSIKSVFEGFVCFCAQINYAILYVSALPSGLSSRILNVLPYSVISPGTLLSFDY